MTDSSDLTVNMLEVLKKRYLLKDRRRHVIESPDALLRRVARHIAKAEDAYARGPGRACVEERFYRIMSDLEFMPNSPTLMNAGTPMGQLCACFVIPKHLKIQAAFQKYSDNSVSKTVNLPSGAGEKDIKAIYTMAHRLRCKGITVYRYGSKKSQVLSFGRALRVDSEYSGGCISSGTCPF